MPTPEDRLLFILTSLKTSALQVGHGRLFGMGQSKAHQWMHVLLPVLLAALRTLGDAPARSLTALAQRLGVAEADAGFVANFAQEVVKGQIPLCGEGIRQPGSRTVRPQYGPRLPPRPPAVVS